VIGLRSLGIAAASRMVTARAGWGQRAAGSTQLAAAGVIAAAAIAFGWYSAYLAFGDVGFDRNGVQVVATGTPGRAPPMGNPDSILVERENVRSVVASLPGVDAVAFGNSVPGNVINFFTRAGLPNDPDRGVRVTMVSADPAYFDVLGLELVDGRSFESSDREAALVNEALARELWQRTDVAGEILASPEGAAGGGIEVVGVVADAAYEHPAGDPRPLMYYPVTPFSAMDSILVRTRLGSAELRSLIQQRIDSGDLDFEMRSVEPLDAIWGRLLAPDRARTWLVTASAALVVLLAAFGFYGTQRYVVSAGRREYAIRAALGAGPRSLGRLVTRRGFMLALPGWLLGSLLAAIAVAWLREDYIPVAVSPIAVTAIVLLGIAGLVAVANAGPARQARRTAPAPLLKEE
jgi:hypothetical protein